MDYRKTAQEILGYVGGSKNIVSAAHCATRLRLVIADNSKADKEAIENVDGVKGVFEASGQLQIILGTGTVNKVFDEFIAIAGITASTKAEAKEAAAEKQNWFMKAIKLLGDIFVPIIPAIVASGFLMGIMNALDFMNANGFLAIDTSSSIYVFANLFSRLYISADSDCIFSCESIWCKPVSWSRYRYDYDSSVIAERLYGCNGRCTADTERILRTVSHRHGWIPGTCNPGYYCSMDPFCIRKEAAQGSSGST